MTSIKPSDHGIVVDHKESGVRYAVSDRNFNPKVHTKVRDLKAGETVRGFQPLTRESLSEAVGAVATPAPTQDAVGDPSDDSATASETQAKPSRG